MTTHLLFSENPGSSFGRKEKWETLLDGIMPTIVQFILYQRTPYARLKALVEDTTSSFFFLKSGKCLRGIGDDFAAP